MPACVSGTTFGRDVVPEVVSTSATSVDAFGDGELFARAAGRAAPSASSVNWPAGAPVPAIS